MSRANMTRRGFLAGLAYLGWFGFMSVSCSRQSRVADEVIVLASKLADFHVDRASAKVVGLEYLRVAPSEAKVEALVDLIVSLDAEQRAEFVQADKRKLGDILRERQREDFEHGRVVSVRGWILSETECRVCALVSLV